MRKNILNQALIYLLFFALIADTQLYAQSNTAKIKVLNKHVVYMNKLTERLLKTQTCLYRLYFTLDSKRNKRNNFYIGSGYSCSIFKEDNSLDKLIGETAILGTKHSKVLNSEANLLTTEYLNINNLCRELEIYIRLKDYTRDGLKKSDEIYHALTIAFLKYNTQKNAYYKKVFDTFKNYSPSNNTEYDNMKMVLDEEKKFFADFQHNVHYRTFTNSLSVDKFLKSIEKTEKVLIKRYYNSKKSKSGKYSGFFSSYKNQLQELKCKTVDGYSVEARRSDGEINQFIKQYVTYMNYYMIHDFNGFVDDTRQTLLYYPVFLANIKIDSIPKQYKAQKFNYSPRKISELIVKNQGKEISKQTAIALNNYIDFINRELKWNYDFSVRLTNLNLRANKQINQKDDDKYLSYTYSDNYAVPLAMYKTTVINSIHIPVEYREILNRNLEDLMLIIHEKHQLVLELNQYIKTKEFKTDNFAKLYKCLKRFELLLDLFDEKKQLQYENCLKVFKSYNEPTENTWKLPANEMLKLLDAELVAFNKIKTEMRNESFNKVSANKVRVIHRELIINQYENLKDLKRIGKNHGDCPYNPYEDIAESAGSFSDRIEGFPYMKLIERNGIKHFRNFTYAYNDYVDDYNKFVELATGGYDAFNSHKKKPTYLLQNVRQPVYYKFIKPEIKEKKDPIIVEEEIDTALISMDGFAVNNLVLLLDVSGSMKAEEKLPLLRKSFLEILPFLRDEDEISVVIFSGKGKVLLNAVSCSKKEKIIKVLESLESQGQTNFDKGLTLAYKTARKNFKPDANNRIIVATDGAFSISDKLYQLTDNEADNNAFLSVFCFGKDTKVRALDKLARKGNGNYENIISKNAKTKLLKELQALKIDD